MSWAMTKMALLSIHQEDVDAFVERYIVGVTDQPKRG
jgi:hypothetical protein